MAAPKPVSLKPWPIPLLAVATVLPFVLVFAGVAVALNHSIQVEQQVRSAQIKRAFVLRLQLDEETGVRGFAATRDRIFLEPYVRAERRMDAAIADLRSAIAPVAPKSVPLIDDQLATHKRWLVDVAKPLIAKPSREVAVSLQLEGKNLIDRFRNDNDTALLALDDAAERSDTFAHRLVYAIIALGLLLGTALLGVMVSMGLRQKRLDEEYRIQSVLHDRERAIADALQDVLMPYDVPSVPGIKLHARYRPADEPERVGGDWYDALPMPDGRILIIIGDVTGHGIAAIELMSRLRRKIIAAAMHQTDPGAILTEANRQALRTYPHEALLGTALCAFVDPKTHQIAYATAGHPAPVFAHPGGAAQLLPSGDLMLGVQDFQYQTYTVHAESGSLLVFYTDGLIEFTRDPLSGEQKLLRTVGTIVGSALENPAAAIGQRILDGAAPHDDVAILTVTFGPVEREAHSALAPSTIATGGVRT